MFPVLKTYFMTDFVVPCSCRYSVKGTLATDKPRKQIVFLPFFMR